ncbi:hypothetical protein [Bacillus sp. FSL W8-0183]
MTIEIHVMDLWEMRRSDRNGKTNIPQKGKTRRALLFKKWSEKHTE